MSCESLRQRLRIALTASLLFSGTAGAAAEFYVPGGVEDPRLRTALYMGESKRHLSAISELLQLQEEEPSADLRWALADNYLSFGLPDRARALYDEIAADPEVDKLRLGRARLRLATFLYERGYLPEANAALQRLREDLPEDLLVSWQDLFARVLLTQGRNAEAVEVLTAPKNGGDQSDYMRYNLAIALIGDGRIEQGRTVLDKVGREDPVDRDTLALADRANMTLGWHFLQSKQGAAARPVLRRVRIEGPYSNRALLGLGWSELTPDGGRAPREDTGDVEPKSGGPFAAFSNLGVLLRRNPSEREEALRSFRRSKGSADDEEALRRALPAWLELVERDPQDPTVQEGWLAIPYALDQLGAYEQARTYYEQAVERLEAARKRTDVAIEALRTNRMVETILKRDLDAESGYNWELRDLPDAPETYYLQTLLAEHRFAEALKNYRDARLLSRNLEAWERRLNDMAKTESTAQRASVDPAVLFARAKETGRPPKLQVPISPPLVLDEVLGAPGRFKNAVEAGAPPPATLKLADVPAHFSGNYERIAELQTRIKNLKPALTKAADAQGRLLQRMGTIELQAQKKQIEKYLVEARFALARLYDRQLSGGDPDEYEIKK